MSIQVMWDDDARTIIRLEYAEQWTWDEVTAALAEEIALLHSVEHDVCIIHDLRQSSGLPDGALTRARQLTTGLPANRDISVVVHGGALIETVVSIFGKINRAQSSRYRTAPTLEQARALIAQHRSTLTK